MKGLGFIVIIYPILMTLAGCYPNDSKIQLEIPLRKVLVSKIVSQEKSKPFTLVGRIEPWQEAVLYFEVPGIVENVPVEDGAIVESGDTIAQLIPTDYQLALKIAEGKLESAQANLDLLLAGTRKEDLEVAQAAFAQSVVKYNYWSSEIRRSITLFEKSTITASELAKVQREYDASTEAKRLAKAQLDRATAGPRKEQISSAKAEVKSLSKAASAARRQLEKAALRAPFSGRVEKRLLDAGAYVNVFPTGGVPVVHLVDLSQVDAVFAVPEIHLPFYQQQPDIEISSAVNPKIRTKAKARSLGLVADRATGTYELRVRLNNPEIRFKGSMVVLATTKSPTMSKGIYIPLSSIRKSYGQAPFVMLLNETTSQVYPREISLGQVIGNRILVRDGLSEGDLLIVSGQHFIIEGDRVKYEMVLHISDEPE